MTFYDLFMFCLGALIDDCQVKEIGNIRTVKLRIFILLYAFGALIITTGYRAAMFAMLESPIVSF